MLRPRWGRWGVGAFCNFPCRCVMCSARTFSVSANQDVCVTHRKCAKTDSVTALGTSSSDTRCTADRSVRMCPSKCTQPYRADTTAVAAQPCLTLREGVCAELNLLEGVFPWVQFVKLYPLDRAQVRQTQCGVNCFILNL